MESSAFYPILSDTFSLSLPFLCSLARLTGDSGPSKDDEDFDNGIEKMLHLPFTRLFSGAQL